MIPSDFLNGLHLRQVQIHDPARLAGGDRIAHPVVEFEISLTLPGITSAEPVHTALAAARKAAAEPFINLRLAHAESAEAQKVERLRQQLADTAKGVDEAKAQADDAQAAARVAIENAKDPTPHERRRRELRLDVESLEFRIPVVRKLLTEAEAESAVALEKRLDGLRRLHVAEAEEEAERLSADLAAVVAERLPAMISAIAARDALTKQVGDLLASVNRDQAQAAQRARDAEPKGDNSYTPFPEPTMAASPYPIVDARTGGLVSGILAALGMTG